MEHLEQQDVAHRRPRTPKACHSCRASKTRCLPIGESTECERCLSSKRECIWEEDKPPSKRIRVSESRTATIEQKIDGLVAPLAQSKNIQSSSIGGEGLHMRRNSGEGNQELLHVEDLSTLALDPPVNERRQDCPGSKTPSRSTPVVAQHTPAPIDLQERGNGALGNKTIPTAASTTVQTIGPNASTLDHALVKDVIDTAYGNTLLNEYRMMAGCFPFVLISPDIAAQDLVKEKPMLFLAICMTACGKTRLLQATLEQRYRHELAIKTIMHAHRSLDCLQSILVYLAWYHLHLFPKRQQINQLLHIATAMAFDLGIGQSPKKAITKMSPLCEANYSSSQRALVGCYYLSATFTMALNIPNQLKLSQYMTDCCDFLQTEQRLPVDATLPHMIRLGQLGDQVRTVLGLASRENFDADNVGLRTEVQTLLSQLKELETESRMAANKNVVNDLSYNFIDMEVHSISLNRNSSSSRAGGTSAQSSTDTFHLDHLLSCLGSAKAYLDAIIAMSVLHYRHLCFAEWMRLPRVIAIICKLCIPSDYYTEIHWDYRMAQERVRVDLYLESLCYRMQSLTTFDKIRQPLLDFWVLLKTLLERIRSWYTHKIRLSTKEGATARHTDTLPLASAIRPQVSTNGHEAQDPAVAPMPEFAELDRIMNDFGNPFWVSDVFDMGMLLNSRVLAKG